MGRIIGFENLIEIKNSAINKMLVVLSLLSVFPQILSFVRALEYGFTLFVNLDFLIAIVLWFITLYRKKLSLQFKAIGLILIVFVGVIVALWNVGLMAPMKYFIAVVPVVLSFFLSFKKSLIFFFSYIIVFGIFAWLYTEGRIPLSVNIATYSNSLMAWAIDALVLTMAAIGVLYVGNSYNNSLLDLNKKILSQNIELENKEKKFRTLFDEANDAITLLKDDKFFDVNKIACELFQCDKNEIIGKSVIDFSPEYQYDGSASKEKAAHVVHLALQGQPQRFEWQHIKANGEIFDVSVSLNKVELQNEFYVQGILRDISEQKSNERKIEAYKNELESAVKKLKVSEAGYKKFIEYNPVGILKVGFREPISLKLSEKEQFDAFLRNAYIDDCNDEYAKAYGYEGSGDIIGKSTSVFWNDPEQESQIVMETIKSGFSWKLTETEEITPKGNKLFMLNSLFSTERTSKIYSFWVIAIDITEQKKNDLELKLYRNHLEKLVQDKTKDLAAANEEWKTTSEELFEKNEIIKSQNTELRTTLQNLKETQSQLLQVEKMASLGVLTAGVAHEINNPLQYLSGAYFALNSYFKKYGSAEDKNTSMLLASVETGIERISAIVKGLNQFSRDNSRFDEDCNVHHILDNCLVVLQNQIKYKADVRKNYHDGTITIKGNVGKMHQVFLNIITNSVQAIKNKGLLTITTKLNKENLFVEIEDTGSGIAKENLTKITEPFFTTKDPGEGTGLGLSISYSIIKDHGGQIFFESELNKGTKVIIMLPLKTK